MERIRKASDMKIEQVIPKEAYKYGWEDRFITTIEVMVEKGMSQKDIARALKVSVSAVEKWARTKPEVKEAMERGRKEMVAKLEQNLLLLANGYEYEEDEIFMYRGEIIRERVIKKVQPNAFANLKLLQVKARGEWTDVKKLNVSGTVNMVSDIDMSDFTSDELDSLEKLGMQQLNQNNGTIE